MVLFHGFEIQLVHATEGEEAFKEHEKDGQHYIEVEPDAEYFIKVIRDNAVRGECAGYKVKTFVDGQCASYVHHSRKTEKHCLIGIDYQSNGQRGQKSLKFTKPDFESFGNKCHALDALGEIKIYIHEAVKTPHPFNRERQVKAGACNVSDLNDGERLKQKIVRSTAGSTLKYLKNDCGAYEFEKKEVGTCTLRYGTAAGLIVAGVLSGPPSATTRAVTPPGVNPTAARNLSTAAASASASAQAPPQSSTRTGAPSASIKSEKARSGLLGSAARARRNDIDLDGSDKASSVIQPTKRIKVQNSEAGISREHDFFDLSQE